ncbi:MAG: alpha/beta fold hydrolase [Myxococcales bacterium]|nr:alpha/beta fold hydrolase [Myxococcales bacterium]
MVHAELAVSERIVSTHDGWAIHLRRTVSPAHLDPRARPLLIVPGYGMNSFIFSYHPRNTSLERWLAEAGFEVWAMNLRAQGASVPCNAAPGPVTLANYAGIDLPRAIAGVREGTTLRAKELTLVGCSLGGTIVYGYLALHGSAGIADVVTMGAPLVWTEVHPLLRVAFASPRLAGAVAFTGTRAMVARAFPFLSRMPSLLSLYMNTRTIDLERIDELTRTVEDPHPAVNRDIAHWLKQKDLTVRGVNVTRALAAIDLPLLVVVSNKDGIVPESTATSVVRAWGGADVEVLRVGTEDNWYAHANLFIANDAPALVFEPMIRWLSRASVTESNVTRTGA